MHNVEHSAFSHDSSFLNNVSTSIDAMVGANSTSSNNPSPFNHLLMNQNMRRDTRVSGLVADLQHRIQFDLDHELWEGMDKTTKSADNCT